jgi:hypothetical protein
VDTTCKLPMSNVKVFMASNADLLVVSQSKRYLPIVSKASRLGNTVTGLKSVQEANSNLNHGISGFTVKPYRSSTMPSFVNGQALHDRKEDVI